MIRNIAAKAALLATLPIVAGVIGCGSKPAEPRVYRFATGDYTFEYDGEQKRVTIGPGLMRMARHPEDIVVADGKLSVGPRDYGAVAKEDSISVVGGKVAVNGRERQAEAR